MTAPHDRVAGALVGLAAGDALASGTRGWRRLTRQVAEVAALTAAGDVDVEAVAAHTGNPPGDAPAWPATVAVAKTTALVLARLGDDDGLVDAARAMARRITDAPEAGQACVLWAFAVDRAVREGRFDGVHEGLPYLDPDRVTAWLARLDAATTQPPAGFDSRESGVAVLQAALAAVWQSHPSTAGQCVHLQEAVDAARPDARDGNGVAALAGALAGARWGASATPFAWLRQLHGPPGERAADLVRDAVLTATGGVNEDSGWPGQPQLADNPVAHHDNDPVAVPLPEDPGVVAGNLAAIREVDVEAVVSLCQVGCRELPGHVEHYPLLLIDALGANPHCGFVLDQAVTAVRVLRREGKRVFVHCVGAASRTPSVVAGYLVRTFGLSPTEAIDRVSELLYYPQHNLDFRDWLLALQPHVDAASQD